MEGPLLRLLYSFRSINKHDRHQQFQGQKLTFIGSSHLGP